MRRVRASIGPAATAQVSRWALIVLCGVLLCVTAAPVVAADPAPKPPPEPTPEVSPPTAAAPDYLFPDLAPQALVLDGTHFWIRPIFAVVTDYTWFRQDDASRAQVGTQENTGELRAGRLGGTLRSKGRLKWELYATVDYQEQRTREGATFQLYDLQLRIPLGPVKVTIGKMKEPFAYELTALSVLLPQQERILLPFFPTRNIGVQFAGQLAGGRMTWAAGAFNDWLETGVDYSKNSTAFDGRVTALVWESPSKRDYLHLGLDLRRAGSDEGMLRLAGRPESNVADKYVDTGNFPANHADAVLLEALWAHGPYSILAEHVDARVDAPESGDPHFSGSYATASWVLTGESRPYVRAGGYAGAILPKSRFGAVELVARYSRLDLTDGPIDGGVLDKWHVGVNWWASAQWKVGISWGDADLDKNGIVGNTKMTLLRLQWLW